MELTGIAKLIFEQWFKQNQQLCEFVNLTTFYKAHESMQWGIYQDFADTLGYHITNSFIGGSKPFCPDIDKNGRIIWEKDFKTRQEARKAAIEALNEIINLTGK